MSDHTDHIQPAASGAATVPVNDPGDASWWRWQRRFRRVKPSRTTGPDETEDAQESGGLDVIDLVQIVAAVAMVLGSFVAAYFGVRGAMGAALIAVFFLIIR